MRGIAILCSGQGAQGPGMFDLFADVQQACGVFESARQVLGGNDPRELVHRGSDADLHSNKTGQILCSTLAMAAWTVIEPWVGRPRLAAGYSIGELAAWGIAGIFSAQQILDLASKRATAMDAATVDPSGLLAVRGLKRPALETICNECGAFIAIINATDQMLAGGTIEALSMVETKAKAAGAERTTLLPVAVASHTPLLAAASAKFRTDLKTCQHPLRLPVGVRLLSGIDGAPVYDVASGTDKLALQIKHTIHWSACMESMRSAGITKMIELGPGSALTRMLQAYFPECDAHSVAEFRTLGGIEAWLLSE